MKLKNLDPIKYLNTVDYYHGYYTLGFYVDGEWTLIDVPEREHPGASTDEDYFDSRELVEKIIEENVHEEHLIDDDPKRYSYYYST